MFRFPAFVVLDLPGDRRASPIFHSCQSKPPWRVLRAGPGTARTRSAEGRRLSKLRFAPSHGSSRATPLPSLRCTIRSAGAPSVPTAPACPTHRRWRASLALPSLNRECRLLHRCQLGRRNSRPRQPSQAPWHDHRSPPRRRPLRSSLRWRPSRAFAPTPRGYPQPPGARLPGRWFNWRSPCPRTWLALAAGRAD